MTFIHNKIEDNRAQSYFEEKKIAAFLKFVEPWDSISKKAFFQITQQQNNPVLEYSCHVDKVLIDVTMLPNQLKHSIMVISSINLVLIQQSENSLELTIETNANSRGFSYIATTDQSKKELLDYGQYLQNILAGKT